MVKTYKELAIIILMPAGISRQNQKKKKNSSSNKTIGKVIKDIK